MVRQCMYVAQYTCALSFHTKICGQKYNNIWFEMVLPDHDYDYDYD